MSRYMSMNVLLFHRVKSMFSKVTNHFFSRSTMDTTECLTIFCKA